MKVLPRRKAEVHTITDAPLPMSQDIDHRQRRYLVSMGIRTVCFVGAIVAAGRAPLWVAALLVVAALVLPYVSVVVANGGREPQPRAPFDPEERSDRKGISGPHSEIGP
ncbi:DUF3099 domain-containing protein [Actinomadura craniellae]|uniref:DUF3099 domain-containing protein n=1 Tax=Actinomadura craniellae TaxID=2231787 RepID=A0A365H6R1_9ACTN|nr:DUF3099 domain-containing protein [Actinomadura craniellae]RAY13953.1 DUF3099 domain-containing protein [Actinomadura craniellae]